MTGKGVLLVGGCGRVGRILKRAWPDAVCVDRVDGADLRFDLQSLGNGNTELDLCLATAKVVIHLATSAEPDDPEYRHFQAVTHTAKLVEACALAGVPKLILASSDWAEPKAPHLNVNLYGHSKRVLEKMADMYAHGEGREAVAIRIGWIPATPSELATAPGWLLENHWTEDRVVEAFGRLV